MPAPAEKKTYDELKYDYDFILPTTWPKIIILLNQLPEIEEDDDRLDPEPLF
jgi:hypothetical protein